MTEPQIDSLAKSAIVREIIDMAEVKESERNKTLKRKLDKIESIISGDKRNNTHGYYIHVCELCAQVIPINTQRKCGRCDSVVHCLVWENCREENLSFECKNCHKIYCEECESLYMSDKYCKDCAEWFPE